MHEGRLADQTSDALLDLYSYSFSPILHCLLLSNRVDGKASCAVLSGGVQGAKEENKRGKKMLVHEIWQVVSTQ